LTRAATILLNAGAKNSAGRQEAVEQAVARAGLDAEVLMIPGAEIPEAAERAAAAGRVLVAAGGDGTVSTVAAVAVRTGSDLGVLPLGTLNHFARDAGIPMDVDGAVDALVDGSITLVDVCEVNDRTFVNNASLGAYPAIVWERDVEQRRGRGKWTGFAIGIWRAWVRYRLIRVRLTLDGTTRTSRTPFVFIGNGEYLVEGLKVGTRASLAGGRLHVYLAPECGRFEALVLPLRALAGRAIAGRGVEQISTDSVEIETRHRRVTIALDGELAVLPTPLLCRVRPGALRLIVPLVTAES
jgi:diacylglycerol kinase family enzyme